MRISDWSSDVCSSDLRGNHSMRVWIDADACPKAAKELVVKFALKRRFEVVLVAGQPQIDRKSVVSGKSVSVRVDLGGRRIIKKKKNEHRLKICSRISTKHTDHDLQSHLTPSNL